MQKSKKSTLPSISSKVILVIILCSLLFTINHFAYKNPKPKFFINMQKDAYHFNKVLIRNFSLGQERLISSLLWVLTLMNLDNEHYKKKDLNSWPYLRFDLIASLDDQFYEAYLFGAQYLSVIKDDLIGAKDLYDRGLKKYPDDYQLNFSAGFHYYFELSNIKSAIQLFKVAQQSPKAPGYLPSLIARLETQRNNPRIAFAFLYNIYQQTADDNSLKKYYHKRLYDLKAYIDLNCLNSGKKDCQRYDFDGDRYIKKEGRFMAIKPISPVKVFTKKKKTSN